MPIPPSGRVATPTAPVWRPPPADTRALRPPAARSRRRRPATGSGLSAGPDQSGLISTLCTTGHDRPGGYQGGAHRDSDRPAPSRVGRTQTVPRNPAHPPSPRAGPPCHQPAGLAVVSAASAEEPGFRTSGRRNPRGQADGTVDACRRCRCGRSPRRSARGCRPSSGQGAHASRPAGRLTVAMAITVPVVLAQREDEGTPQGCSGPALPSPRRIGSRRPHAPPGPGSKADQARPFEPG